MNLSSCLGHSPISNGIFRILRWLKDGQPLRTGSRVRLLSKDHVRVTSVSKEDQGMFQCFVKNDIDTAEGIAEISLGEVAPQLHYRFIEQTLQPGPGKSNN